MLRVWTTTIQDDSLGVNAMRVKAIEKFNKEINFPVVSIHESWSLAETYLRLVIY